MASSNKNTCLGEFLISRLQALRGVAILIDDFDENFVESFTGDLALLRAIRIADCLRANGLKPGDEVAIYCDCRSEVFFLTIGALLIGVSVAFIDVELGSDELLKIITGSQFKYIYTITRLGKILLKLTQTIKPRGPRIVAFGDEFFGPSTIHPFNAMIRNADVPYRMKPDDFRCDSAQSVNRPALIGFGFSDANGQLKKFFRSENDVLAEVSAADRQTPTFRSIKTLKRWNNLEHVVTNLLQILSIPSKGKL